MMRLLLVAAIAVGYTFFHFFGQHGSTVTSPRIEASLSTELVDAANQRIRQAFQQREHGVAVQSTDVVTKLLSDDNDGSRHQRFILKLENGMTLLVAHNIDLAPRVDSLQAGDNVEFNGDYEWNNKGGVIHWTHHDPRGRHADGWLRHNGRLYQ